MRKKQETNVTCPTCGTELAIAGKKVTIVETATASTKQAQLPKTAHERIEALRSVGVDVSCLFAMQGANGGDYVASNKDGKLSILDDNDPIFDYILEKGTVPNRRLFRRFVMAQMFHMLSYKDYGAWNPVGVTEMIHRLGYEYQWKMLLDELRAQMKMERNDPENFADRNRWFNVKVATAMAEDYIEQLKAHVDGLPVKKCKGIPYKRLGSHNIFVQDLHSKLYSPLRLAAYHIGAAKNATQLYNAVKKFNEKRFKMKHATPQSKAWIDAYKGTGAFYTMQNLIRFHNCTATDDSGRRLDKYQSLAFLSAKAEEYKNGNGWRLLAVLKKMLDDNGIDIKKKMAQWRRK